jgi:hypothetical protein
MHYKACACIACDVEHHITVLDRVRLHVSTSGPGLMDGIRAVKSGGKARGGCGPGA